MSANTLYKDLNYVNHSREKRSYYANLLIETPALIPDVLDIIFKVDDKISCRAAWIFEFACDKNLDIILPYLDLFTQNINRVHLDSAVRPVAKICEFIAKAYYSKTDNAIKSKLSPKYKERIIETAFDWMISDQKVAVKAYSMSTLYLFGKDKDWIYPELSQILEQDFSKESAAYKARAKRILKKIKAK